LQIDNGVATDEYLAASAPGIYAAGDVANAWHPDYGRRIRLEHWSAALNQGPVAATNMLGKPLPYTRTPYFFSDQYDFGMEYRGWAPEYDEVVVRGDPARREFLAFWIRDGKVAAAMNVNIWDQGEQIETLIRSTQTVDVKRLGDPAIDLAQG
ncbi:MAG: NAD(P)/FAD-dependent oxidoreductase, partial [Acidimicrobiaceae bacterium]|nr:NAD(P)/FAD-dependent oxidoreductase [Acidimicrobiaceae bacterium]